MPNTPSQWMHMNDCYVWTISIDHWRRYRRLPLPIRMLTMLDFQNNSDCVKSDRNDNFNIVPPNVWVGMWKIGMLTNVPSYLLENVLFGSSKQDIHLMRWPKRRWQFNRSGHSVKQRRNVMDGDDWIPSSRRLHPIWFSVTNSTTNNSVPRENNDQSTKVRWNSECGLKWERFPRIATLKTICVEELEKETIDCSLWWKDMGVK